MLAKLRSQKVLWNTGLFHCALACLALGGILIDAREVGGLNPWIKPLKFDLSIAIYLWTMAWILAELPRDFGKRIGLGMAAAMIFETVLIHLQALRGVKSHFNNSTPFNGAVYALMGVVILINFAFVIRVTVWFFRQAFPTLPKLTLRGIQFGLVSLIYGNLLGIYMAAQPGHSVGVPDGGPGLFFLNWSRTGGDLRIAHFAGLHGVQFFILLGAYFSKPQRVLSEQNRLLCLHALFAVYLAVCTSAFAQALLGIPLLPQ